MYGRRVKQIAPLDERLAEIAQQLGTRPQHYRPAERVKTSSVNCGKQR